MNQDAIALAVWAVKMHLKIGGPGEAGCVKGPALREGSQVRTVGSRPNTRHVERKFGLPHWNAVVLADRLPGEGVIQSPDLLRRKPPTRPAAVFCYAVPAVAFGNGNHVWM